MSLNYRRTAFPLCCGLDIASGLTGYGNGPFSTKATVAVTSPYQSGLYGNMKAAGFKEVAEFMGIHGYKLKLWLRQKGAGPKKPTVVVPNGKSGRYTSRATGRAVTDNWARQHPTKVFDRGPAL